MRRFNEDTGFDAARESTLFTVAALEASGRHERLARTIGQHLARWAVVREAREAAADGHVRARAVVVWTDFVLDGAVKGFGNELLRDAGGDASDKVFREFFPEAPSDVVRLGLESEVARCEAFAVIAAKRKLSKSASGALAAVTAAVEAGRRALAARRAAVAKVAEASLDVESWKEAADAARRSAHVALQAWALENGEERSYAERFFPDATAPRRAAKPDAPADG